MVRYKGTVVALASVLPNKDAMADLQRSPLTLYLTNNLEDVVL